MIVGSDPGAEAAWQWFAYKGMLDKSAKWGYVFRIIWRRIMLDLNRITFNPEIMGGRPCLRGMRVTVGMIVGLIASGHTYRQILDLYPYLEDGDIEQALSYAAWRVEEMEAHVVSA